MGRTIKGKVKISEVFFDQELYPRSHYSWQVGFMYSKSMEAGAKFPPIVLALFNGKKYLVDGKHRLEAYKLLKKDTIEAVVYTGWNKQKIFVESVKANVSHGKQLSPYEKRTIAMKLMEMKMKNQDISKLIQVPIGKLDNFIESRLVYGGEEITPEQGEEMAKEIGRAILKSGVKHFAGQTLSSQDMGDIEVAQKDFHMSSQVALLSQLADMLEKDLIDRNNKQVMKLLMKVKKILDSGDYF